VSFLQIKRLPSDPLEALRAVIASESELEALRIDLVRQSRAQGRSWEDIAIVLGMARQSVWEFYNVRVLDELENRVAENSELTEEEATRRAVEEVRSVRQSRRTK
jgi:hypothetical protein